MSQDIHHILPSKVIKQSNTFKSSNIFFWVLLIVSQILLDSLYFLIRKRLINSHRLIISPGGCFMKRQQLVWLFLSLSGCSVHMIAGIYWRNLLSLSLCLLSSISSSEVGGQEGAEGVTPKSIPLAHKSGIFHREKKGNTYATSTHFPCFLQNQSNCKTVLYLRDPPIGHHSPSSSGYCGHAVSHRKTRCVFFKPWGSNLSQFFRIQFKGVSMELLAPICKREKKQPVPSFYWRRTSLL